MTRKIYAIWDTEKNEWWAGKNAAYYSSAAAKNSWMADFSVNPYVSKTYSKRHKKFDEQSRYIVLEVELVIKVKDE